MVEQKNYWQKRLSRRRVLQGAAMGGAGLTAAAIIGCGDDDDEGGATPTSAASPGAASPAGTGTPAAKQPKKGGTLTHLAAPSGSFTTGFDPHRVAGTSEGGIMSLFYSHLIRIDPRTLEPKPQLAQKWEVVSPSEFVFTLTPGVKWHNKAPVSGRELTAEDVVFSLKRIGSPEPEFRHKALVSNLDKIEAVDKGTVRITTKVPDASTLVKLTELNALILAPEAVEAAGVQVKTVDLAIGTGPFILNSQDDTGAQLSRNPAYFKQGLPYLDNVRLVAIQDPNTAWAAFLSGQLDVNAVPGNEATKFYEQQKDKYSLDWFKDTAMWMNWPNTAKAPFSDPRVAKALRLLVDHTEAIKAWAEVWNGRGSFISFLPPILESWDFSQEELGKLLEWKQPKDEAVKEALSLLSASGFTASNPLKFEQINVGSLAIAKSGTELLQAMYKRLSGGVVDTTIQLGELPQITPLMAQGNYAFAGPIARGASIETDTNLRNYFYSKGGNNFGKYNDAKADALIDKQREIIDTAERKKVVKELLQHLLDTAPYTTIAGLQSLFAAQPKVKDVAPEGATHHWGFQYEWVWMDV